VRSEIEYAKVSVFKDAGLLTGLEKISSWVGEIWMKRPGLD
jgi:hypothetical protein